jgi:hypothetical protein
MTMAAGEPPPRATRAYKRAPRASLALPSLHTRAYPPPCRLLCAKPSSPPPIEAGRRRRSPSPSSSSSFPHPSKLPRPVRNSSPPFFLILPNRRACRRSPAAGDPPPRGASHHGRRSHLLDHLVGFPVTPAPRRTKSRPSPWSLAQVCVRRRTSNEVPAGRRCEPAVRRRQARADVRNR